MLSKFWWCSVAEYNILCFNQALSTLILQNKYIFVSFFAVARADFRDFFIKNNKLFVLKKTVQNFQQFILRDMAGFLTEHRLTSS